MDRQSLINRVATKLDEITPIDEVVVDVGLGDENPIYQTIEALLDECAKEVLTKAPIHRLTPTASPLFLGTPMSSGAKYGYIPLPADYIRLVELKMEDWARAVTQLELPDSPLARRQTNKYLRGGTQKPVAVLGSRNGGAVIEYYSIRETHTIQRFLYIKSDVAQNIPAIYTDALEWLCVSRCLNVFNKNEAAKVAMDNAISLMQ